MCDDRIMRFDFTCSHVELDQKEKRQDIFVLRYIHASNSRSFPCAFIWSL